MNPSPLRHLRHKKAWKLIHVYSKLQDQGTPVSWPTLEKIDHGFKSVRDKDGNMIRKKYTPQRRILVDIAKLFKVKPDKIYEDRSKD